MRLQSLFFNIAVPSFATLMIYHRGRPVKEPSSHQEGEMQETDIQGLECLPAAESCRRIDFETSQINPGIVPNTWFLTVTGVKPWVNM